MVHTFRYLHLNLLDELPLQSIGYSQHLQNVIHPNSFRSQLQAELNTTFEMSISLY